MVDGETLEGECRMLAPLTDAAVLERIQEHKLIEGIEHMSPAYLEGMKRILTVSADTELVSSPAYYHAARHAPNINTFGSAVAIMQDELGHAHIAYRLLRDLGVDTDELVYYREPKKWKYPYAFDVPLDSWYELIVANAFYDRAGLYAVERCLQQHDIWPLEARAGEGGQGRDVPSAARRAVDAQAGAGAGGARALAAGD